MNSRYNLRKTKWGGLASPKPRLSGLRSSGRVVLVVGDRHRRGPGPDRQATAIIGGLEDDDLQLLPAGKLLTHVRENPRPLLHTTHKAHELRLKMQTPGRTTPLLDVNLRKKLST